MNVTTRVVAPELVVLDTSIGMKGVVTMIPAALILMAEAVWAAVVMVGLAQIGGR
jgi:hypothetical protein